jgi:thioredoxin-like negative regulator of GroEL
MNNNNDLEKEIERLSIAIEASAGDAALYMERAKLYNGAGRKDKALNDYLKVLEIEPGNAEARQHAKMIQEIFEYHYVDLYNP